ncbi:MAG: YicC/YloC family endoribonuclease [Thermodesulfobacteriota bacterium]
MKSMTGFGKNEAETKYGKVVVEARSENHRFLDIKMMLPETISSIENELAETVKKLVLRGKIRITVSLEGMKGTQPVLNLDLAKELKKSLNMLKKEFGIKEELRLEHFLMVKDIFTPGAGDHPTSAEALEIGKVLQKAIKKLDDTRKVEGKKLEKDFKERLNKIERLSHTISVKRKEFMQTASLKLKERISRILDESQIDEAKLYQETAFLAERSDITEELVRLKAHISKFREIIGSSGSIGKELDFLLQEMNREAGTIAAKAKDAEISHFTIDLRSELEKIREQLQNIE